MLKMDLRGERTKIEEKLLAIVFSFFNSQSIPIEQASGLNEIDFDIKYVHIHVVHIETPDYCFALRRCGHMVLVDTQVTVPGLMT